MDNGSVKPILSRHASNQGVCHRLGDFDHCQLQHAPARDPVCTPRGHLYGREAILRYILAKKKENRRVLGAWEAAQAARSEAAAGEAAEAREAELREFERANSSAGPGPAGGARGGEVRAAANSHWIPAKTPGGAEGPGARPSQDVLCPASGKRLRLKDLVPVRFTPAEGDGGAGGSGRHRPGGGGRYMDPLTRETLTNKDSLVVLRPTGDVLKRSTYVRAVKPDGVYNGKAIAEKDVIPLQKGGTGFAAHDGEALEASRHFAVGMGSGRADLRGQGGGGGSKFGLKFGN